MKARKRFFNLYLGLSSLQVWPEIVIDGELSEEEWELAREINEFYEVFPFSLNDADVNTKILIQQDEKGIYFGFINT